MHRPSYRLAAPVLAGVILLAVGATGASGSTSSAVKAHSSKPTYTIAYEGPLSGGNAQLGLNMQYAVELAVNNADAGKTFGTLPFKLKFLAADDGGSATESPTTAAQLINDGGVIAVVGPSFSGATKAAEPAFSSADLATVSPSATAPALATEGWNNFFRVVADDNGQGPADAEYVAKVLKDKSVYTVDDASAYASGLIGAFDAKASSLKLTVTHQTAPGTTQCMAGTGDVTEYGALSTQIKQSGDPIVFYAGYYCDFSLLAKQLRTAGYTGQLVSDDGSLDPHYVSEAGAPVADGTLLSCACADLTKGGEAGTFATQFKKLAKFPVGTYSAEAYDAANTIIDVMKGIGAHVTRGKVVSGLHKVTYVGLTKTVHFQSDGDIKGTAVYMYKVKSGNIVVIGLISKLI